MNRRNFLLKSFELTGIVGVFSIVGCGKQGEEPNATTPGIRTATLGEVIMYDTYAMALYYDGGLGPKTGILKIDYILANQPVTLDFWHGHGGKVHKYTLTPDHFKELKKLKKIYVETTLVESHAHKLFIDPADPKWRVPGAKPVSVPTETLMAP